MNNGIPEENIRRLLSDYPPNPNLEQFIRSWGVDAWSKDSGGATENIVTITVPFYELARLFQLKGYEEKT